MGESARMWADVGVQEEQCGRPSFLSFFPLFHIHPLNITLAILYPRHSFSRVSLPTSSPPFLQLSTPYILLARGESELQTPSAIVVWSYELWYHGDIPRPYVGHGR